MRTFLKKAAFGVCAVLAAGVSQALPTTFAELVAEMRYTQGRYMDHRELRGMKLGSVDDRGVFDDVRRQYIRGVHKAGTFHHQVVVDVKYIGGWRFYRSASLNDKSDLAFDILERQFARCDKAHLQCEQREVVVAEVSRSQLNAAMTEGLNVIFDAKAGGGRTEVFFPAVYVRAYLTKLDGSGAPAASEMDIAAIN